MVVACSEQQFIESLDAAHHHLHNQSITHNVTSYYHWASSVQVHTTQIHVGCQQVITVLPQYEKFPDSVCNKFCMVVVAKCKNACFRTSVCTSHHNCRVV